MQREDGEEVDRDSRSGGCVLPQSGRLLRACAGCAGARLAGVCWFVASWRGKKLITVPTRTKRCCASL